MIEPESQPQILIVEDDPDINTMMKMVLEGQDHWQATTATCGARALEEWQSGDFDVIIMDLKLPEMDGIEVTRKIRGEEKRSGRPRTPIIAFTALATEDSRKKFIDAGVDEFIPKPATLQSVVEAVEKFLPS